MAKLNGIMLTEKGALKPVVRGSIAEREVANFDLAGYEKVENKNVFTKEYVDKEGNTCYATYTLTVSVNDPRIEKPKATKKVSKETETFEIVD